MDETCLAPSLFLDHNLVYTNPYEINQRKIPLISGKQQLARKLHLNIQTTKAKATDGGDPGIKRSSVICADCDGNGAVLCSQCKGSGVNSVDFFNGEFKAGASCWLCGGKKDMMCGNCNGAGFLGGFMTDFVT